jgi:hypothetical protein
MTLEHRHDPVPGVPERADTRTVAGQADVAPTSAVTVVDRFIAPAISRDAFEAHLAAGRVRVDVVASMTPHPALSPAPSS